MQQQRRQFILNSLRGAAGLACMGSIRSSLAASSRILTSSATQLNDHKALVVVFLYGGCDSFNLLVPTENHHYAEYAQVRQSLAFEQTQLLPISNTADLPYHVGMPQAASSLHQLFEQQELAIVANVGPMSEVYSKAELLATPSLLPPQLFSHNDQQSLWESASLNTSSVSGWGGRMADLLADTNDNLSMNFSLHGANLTQLGELVQPFAIAHSGIEQFEALDPSKNWNQRRNSIFQRILNNTHHPLQQSYANRIHSAADNNARISEALLSTNASSINYPQDNSLAEQLKMVARLLAAQPVLGQARQIYFVGMGGWDTHDDQSTRHPQLLAELGDALLAFQHDITERQLANQVTTLSMSEFGRTLTSNGDGTDHGWGGHQ